MSVRERGKSTAGRRRGPRVSGARGFTLLEFLLYMGIVAVTLVFVTLFATGFIEVQAKASALKEAQWNADLSMQRILIELREASGINTGSSTFDTSPGVLSLSTSDVATDPTVFSVTSGTLYVQQGAGPALPLTSSRVDVRDLVFDDLSVAGRTRIVGVRLTVGSRDAVGYQQAEAETTLYGSARVYAADGFSN